MIYIVEDDDSIRELEEYVLRSAGFTVQGFTSARDFWAACAQQPPRLAVLDIMLPDEDGMSILHKLRADPATRALPVMLVTAKGAELDRVRGLEDGADDYLAKPFGVMEFSARIKALLRRSGAGSAPAAESGQLACGPIRMDTERRTVTVNNQPVELSFKEYELLRLFLEQPGVVQTRDAILRRVWDTDFIGESRTIDMHVRTLRQKLGEAGSAIQTVRKVGYKLDPET